MDRTDIFFLENKPLFSGKIRDVYKFNEDKLLIKTSDKISAYDFVFDDELSTKGELLTTISKFWFKQTEHIIDNHLLVDNELAKLVPNTFKSCSLVKKCEPIRIESIVRGYISGSAFKQYKKEGKVSDIVISKKMNINDKFDSPLFTPSTKAEVGGKDVNITFAEMCKNIGEELSNFIKDKSIELYEYAHRLALTKGLTLIDCKFEFGYDDEMNVILIDEIFTPDCARYCLTKDLENKDIDFFDKQYFRNYLDQINWNRKQIIIPTIVKEEILNKYRKVLTLLTDEK